MNKLIFNTESKMQEWLKEKLQEDDDFGNLIVNRDSIRDNDCNYESVFERKIHNTYKYCLNTFSLVTIMFENTNISLKEGEVLKPDFVLYSAEYQSIIIVELKNLLPPSRQAGTEISAYASEIKTHIPFISEGDVISVIISQEWSTLLKHYAFHEIFWLQRNLICLQPVYIDGRIKLQVLDVKHLVSDNVQFKLGYQHLGGYQICLYDDNLYNENNNRTRLDPYIEQMKAAILAMAAKGNSHKNHGFAFLWKDNFEISLAPYSITVINFIPFNSLERFFHNDNFEINDVTEKFVKIIKDYAPEGHGQSLDEISNSGIKFLEGICSPRREGFLTWDILQDTILGSNRGTLLSFHCWGIFYELHIEKVYDAYQDKSSLIKFDNPLLGLELLNELIDPNYKFIDLSYLDYDPRDEEE